MEHADIALQVLVDTKHGASCQYRPRTVVTSLTPTPRVHPGPAPTHLAMPRTQASVGRLLRLLPGFTELIRSWKCQENITNYCYRYYYYYYYYYC